MAKNLLKTLLEKAIKETENLLPVLKLTIMKQSNCISIECPFEDCLIL